MRGLLTIFAILVAPVVAQEPEEPPVPEEVLGEIEPEVPQGRIFRGERDAPAVSVRLREGGLLEAKIGETWRDVTLNGLATVLADSRDRYEIEQLKIGKSGLEDVEPFGKASRLFLSLEADPLVPWQHVQWLFTIAMEMKYRKVEMSEGKRRLLVFLPVDAVVCGFSEDYRPPPKVKAEVHAVARAEQPAKWGDAEILRPTEVRYRCGDAETTDLAEVTAYLKKTKKAVEEAKDGKVVFYGEIKSGNKVPYGKVFDVMEAFVAAGIDCVEFYGTAIPPRAIREAKRLPYPMKNYGTGD